MVDEERTTVNWYRLKAEAKRQWDRFGDDDLDRIDGNFERIVALLRHKYGYDQARAEKEAKAFFDKHR